MKAFPTAGVVPGERSPSPAQDSAGKPGGVRHDRATTVLIRKLQKLQKPQELPRRDRPPGLKPCHETGQLLNLQFGGPTRLCGAYYKDTIGRVAASLGMKGFELARMQWLAFNFRTPEDLEARYPGAKEWSRAKILKFVDSLIKSRCRSGTSRSGAPQGAPAGRKSAG